MGGFPVHGPEGVTGWWRRRPEPIVGPEAEADLDAIAAWDPGLASDLLDDVLALLDRRPSLYAERIPDPQGVGPRFMIDLRGGYVAVFWVLPPPRELPRAGNALWVERVVHRSEPERAFAELAREADDDPAG